MVLQYNAEVEKWRDKSGRINIEAPTKIKRENAEMMNLLNIITLQKFMSNSGFPDFYELIIKDGLYGYLSIKENMVIGIYRFAPKDKKHAYQQLKKNSLLCLEKAYGECKTNCSQKKCMIWA